ncbi:MAG: glycosyltransferase family 2 protein [Anaerolineales bacterium]|nr:glycosyltransferase family 2 protein [Anaerolineales bacterium]
MSQPRLSIILLTLNGGQPLANTLDAIAAQDLAAGPSPLPPPEIVAIDSGSRDGTLAVLRARGLEPHRIPSEQFSHGGTRNLGARLAQGNWLIYLSQDAVPAHPRWLANLTRHLHDPQVAAAFGRQLPPAGMDPIGTFFLEQTYPPRAFRHAPTPPGAERTSIQRIFFSNVNAAIRKEVWARCPFPEDLIMSEDQAFARAALAAGYSLVYDPEAGVTHGHRYSLPQLFRRQFDSGYSLRGIAGDSFAEVARLGLDYVWTEMRYLARGGHWAHLPYALLHEAVRSLGFAAGRNGHRLPDWLRPRLSLHSHYWTTRHG